MKATGRPAAPLAEGGGLAELFAALKGRAMPPVHLWHPACCGDIDIRIARDGTWYYMGTPIGRPAMVRLFASVLRLEADGRHYLVTPVEKVGIKIEDAPFLAVEMLAEGAGREQRLSFRTNVDDVVSADAGHPIRVDETPEGPSPKLMVRDGLEALIARPLFYDLVALAEPDPSGPEDQIGVWSGGLFFPLGRTGG